MLGLKLNHVSKRGPMWLSILWYMLCYVRLTSLDLYQEHSPRRIIQSCRYCKAYWALIYSVRLFCAEPVWHSKDTCVTEYHMASFIAGIISINLSQLIGSCKGCLAPIDYRNQCSYRVTNSELMTSAACRLFSRLTIYVLMFQQKHKHVFTISIIPPHWYDTGSWNPFSCMTSTDLIYMTWRRKGPGFQQPWCLPSQLEITWSLHIKDKSFD